ncbi:hypothetical protein MRX96_056001 [Rhipicephalus microplus]
MKHTPTLIYLTTLAKEIPTLLLVHKYAAATSAGVFPLGTNTQVQCKPEHPGAPRVVRRVCAATETACLRGHSAHLTQLLVLHFVHLA